MNANLFKLERGVAKALIKAFLEIRGQCNNPIVDMNCKCENCVFNADDTNCGKLFLGYWLDNLEEQAMIDRMDAQALLNEKLNEQGSLFDEC